MFDKYRIMKNMLLTFISFFVFIFCIVAYLFTAKQAGE